MSEHIFVAGAEPGTPDTGKGSIFFNSSSKTFKQKDDTGAVKDFTTDNVFDGDAIHDNVAAEISAITEKTTPVGADLLLIEDSAASDAKKKLTIANLESNLTLDSLNGTLGIAKGGTGETTKTPAFDALAPTTTKGDLSVHNGSDNIREPIGSDTQVLTADSAQASGMKWATVAAGGGSQLDRFNANDASFPASSPAVAQSRNEHPVLAFDDTTDENVIFNSLMSEDYSDGALTVEIHWVAKTATTGDVKWDVAFETLADAGQDIDSDSFATVQSSTDTTDGTSGKITVSSIAFTQAQADAIAKGDVYRLKLTRDANAGGDTLSGDAEVLRVSIKQ